MTRPARLWALTLAPVLALGCGSENGNNPPPGGGLCLNISGSVDASGLSIRKPEEEVQGCRGVPASLPDARMCEKKAPDLSCLGQSDPLGTPISVIMTGCVKSFGLEAQSDDLTVTILRERLPNGASVDPGYDHSGSPGSQAENTPAARIGAVRSTSVPREQCFDLGHFRMEGVPTETPLIVRVTDQQFPKGSRQYIDTYQYNVILRNREIRQGPTADAPSVADPATYCASNPCYVVDDVNTVVDTTFRTVAITAGVSQINGSDDLYDGVGQGHVAGEVRDCTSEDTLKNAVVALSAPVRKLAYFNVDYPPSLANLEDPKVDQSRTRTNADGLYAAIAVDTDGRSPLDIGAAITRSVCGPDGVCRCAEGKENPNYSGPDEGEADVVVLGKRSIYVFPDSITILTFDRDMYTTP